jgi:hypothetical protein
MQYQGNNDRDRKLRYTVSTYTPYSGAAGMFLHINGNFTIGKLKSCDKFVNYLQNVIGFL